MLTLVEYIPKNQEPVNADVHLISYGGTQVKLAEIIATLKREGWRLTSPMEHKAFTFDQWVAAKANGVKGRIHTHIELPLRGGEDGQA
jgi:aryl carrier-like protein